MNRDNDLENIKQILDAIDILLAKFEQKENWGAVTDLGKIREMVVKLDDRSLN